MSLAPFSLIKTRGLILILFSCFSLAVAAATVNDDGYHGGAISDHLHQPSRRSRKEQDNIAFGDYEQQREENIRKEAAAAAAAEKPFAISGGGYISGKQLAPEVAHAQPNQQAVDSNGRMLTGGSSFSFKQDSNDDSSISLTTSYSVNESRPVTARRFDGHALVAATISGSNPLIESDVSNVVAAAAAAAFPKLKYRTRRAISTIRHRPHEHQIDGFKYWCHRKCNSTRRSRVCASDGRLYGSLCELMRHSCRHNVHLFKRSASHCVPQMDRNRSLLDGAIAVDDDDDDDDYRGDDEAKLASRLNEPLFSEDEGQEVNIVELKGRCNRAKLEEMKLLLLRQFDGDIETIFESFDSNNDQFIEAHELWPKQDTAIANNNNNNNSNNKSLYAQVWDEHSSKCRLGHSGLRYHINGDKSKCWFFLDFAFEPRYPTNPCSLSHLILFDLKHPTSRFTLNTFQQAFQNVLEAFHYANNNTVTLKQDQFKPIKRITTTRLYIGLGETVKLNCMPNSKVQIPTSIRENLIDEISDDQQLLNSNGAKCLWTRYNLNMAAKFDTHISVKNQNIENKKNFHDLTLHIRDAQLYLSGQFKCSCSFDRIEHNFEHIYDVQVLAKPRVTVRPKFQWSLPHSRISFECQYDHIDTSFGDKTPTSTSKDAYRYNLNETDEANGQFGIQVKWLKENQNLIVDSKKFANTNSDASYMSSRTIEEKTPSSWLTSDQDDQFYMPQDEIEPINPSKPGLSSSSLRASITMAASRLTLENLQLNDTGQHTCRVEVPIQSNRLDSSTNEASIWLPSANNNDDTSNNNDQANVLVGEANGSLLVQEQPISEQSDDGNRFDRTSSYLWMFHDNGISVYKLQNDDGQEMELVKEINGHSMASGEVDGNWNQLTLCGGLNPEQVVICEWSDNAVRVEVNQVMNDADVANDKSSTKTNLRKYVYIGQPNLNRVVVLDGLRFEIVAIVNTEPQPRKLHLYKPNKVHLSKWVRRRLSPVANARWLAAIGTHAHSLKSTPADSRLYSNEPSRETLSRETRTNGLRDRRRDRRRAYSSSTNQLPSALIQHDIWLLCYGQPLVVDPSGDESSEEDAIANNFYSTLNSSSDNNIGLTSGLKQMRKLSLNTIQPFTPRISPPFPLWPIWSNAAASNNKESKLRNRKSVHIIQSTFFPQTPASRGSSHNHDEDNQANAGHEEGSDQMDSRPRNHSAATSTFVGEFKRSAVLTTHHIFSSLSSLENGKAARMYLKRAANGNQQDLLQDLFIPSKPYSLELNNHHKIHYAYVTHYDERRLFRVNMDEYRYDRAIDLENCDPINLMTTAQGLLIVQCRSLITHNLIGQLVLDQLTSSRIEFNGNIRAQESYLSPDNRYLISIHNNSTLTSSGSLEDHDRGPSFGQQKRSIPTNDQQQDHLRRQASIVYVQLVTITGLKLQYEIKTSLEMSQCSFVWKDGYYAAILVSTNRRDQQSEILSLRLADSRLELMARVSGVISRTRHKEQLIVSQELRLAALSTNQGTYVIDLEDNRVSQSLRYHQSAPTLLWV